MTTVIGIDIGLSGAIAAVDSRGTFRVDDLPTVPDGKGRRLQARDLILLVREIVAPGAEGVIVFEDVRPRPMGNGNRQGNTMHSQGSLMRSRGIVEAVADISRLRVIVVQPQTWKRHFGLLKTEKGASRAKAIELYPEAELRLKRVKDHNRAESLLLARYGLESEA